MLGLSLHDWENAMVLFLIIAGFFGLIAGAATWAVVRLQRIELAQSQKELEEYKLTVEGKVADAKKEGIEAGKTAADALIRAAELEKEAAEARAETERLKGQFAWRELTPDQAKKFTDALNPLKISVLWFGSDPEQIEYARMFSDALESAHLLAGSGGGGIINPLPPPGLSVAARNPADGSKILSALSAAGLTAGRQTPLPIGGDASLLIGPKIRPKL
jgi:hypothetical protein